MFSEYWNVFSPEIENNFSFHLVLLQAVSLEASVLPSACYYFNMESNISIRKSTLDLNSDYTVASPWRS